ncbi:MULTISPECIES: hypothetical protein [Streptomyces]|uniref:hypothetical protein n=1 Tax=Streptomyces TaxID=1883 RepID=UPI0036867319
MHLLFIPLAGPVERRVPPAPPRGSTTQSWTDPRHAALIAVWERAQPPPDVAAFIWEK